MAMDRVQKFLWQKKYAKVTLLYTGYTECIFILVRTVTDSLNDKLIGKFCSYFYFQV